MSPDKSVCVKSKPLHLLSAAHIHITDTWGQWVGSRPYKATHVSLHKTMCYTHSLTHMPSPDFMLLMHLIVVSYGEWTFLSSQSKMPQSLCPCWLNIDLSCGSPFKDLWPRVQWQQSLSPLFWINAAEQKHYFTSNLMFFVLFFTPQRGKQSRQPPVQVSLSLLACFVCFRDLCLEKYLYFYFFQLMPTFMVIQCLLVFESLFKDDVPSNSQSSATLLIETSWGAVWSSGCRLRLSLTAGLSRDPTSLTSSSNTSRYSPESKMCTQFFLLLLQSGPDNWCRSSLTTLAPKLLQTVSNYSCDGPFKPVSWWL